MGPKDLIRRVNFMCFSSVLTFKFAFSKAVSIPYPLYHRFAAEDILVGLEVLNPFCSKYNISLQIRFSY